MGHSSFSLCGNGSRMIVIFKHIRAHGVVRVEVGMQLEGLGEDRGKGDPIE